MLAFIEEITFNLRTARILMMLAFTRKVKVKVNVNLRLYQVFIVVTVISLTNRDGDILRCRFRL